MDVEYEESLQRAVWEALKVDEPITVNTARERAERELGLDAGFFKNDAVWKAKSKEIVQAAVEDPQSPPEKPKAKPKPAVTKAKAGTKRKSSDVQPAANKRSKKVAKTVPDSDVSDSEVEVPKKSVKKEQKDESGEEEASEFGDSDVDEKPKAKKVRGKAAPKPQAKPATKRKPASKKNDVEFPPATASDPYPESDSSKTDPEAQVIAKAASAAKRKAAASKKSQDVVKSESEDEDVPPSKATKEENGPSEAADSKNDNPPKPEDDESDMSVLIDDPPPPKKKRASKGEPKAKASKPTKPAATKKKGPDLTPDEEEIKRLQGWLVKCGMRKMWHNELKGCDTDKAKIKHLKKMLEDVGMTGRMSNEKASSIKEARELADEIAAAQEYEAQWGLKDKKEDSEDDEDESGSQKEETKGAAPPRRPKGFVDFGDSGDESD